MHQRAAVQRVSAASCAEVTIVSDPSAAFGKPHLSAPRPPPAAAAAEPPDDGEQDVAAEGEVEAGDTASTDGRAGGEAWLTTAKCQYLQHKCYVSHAWQAP